MMKEQKGGGPKERRGPPSRGIPSARALYLPAHDSKEVRAFEVEGRLTKNVWPLPELLRFIFPPAYQETYYRVALSFLQRMAEKGSVDGEDIGAFLREEGVSKATFYNKVLPKLRAFGLVKAQRTRDRGYILTLSKTFSNYLYKIAESWEAFVDDVRSRR